MQKKKLKINFSWTLFLDRDGVMNVQLPGAYVRFPEELKILPGVPEAMVFFAGIFGHIFVATNQQGIGKGLMTESELHIVHYHLWQKILETGGRIDEFYFCPGLAGDNPPCRKPNPGMAFEAKRDFPAINLEKSVMVGDKITDMEFGKNVGMTTVFIAGETTSDRENIDYTFKSLTEFADFIKNDNK